MQTYKNYLEIQEALWADVVADGKDCPWGSMESHAKYEAFLKASRRTYQISARYNARVSPNTAANYPFTVWVFDEPHGGNPLPHQLLPEEHRVVADIVELAWKWAQGRVSYLPPDGKWKKVKASLYQRFFG